jgi:hypothetical protein
MSSAGSETLPGSRSNGGDLSLFQLCPPLVVRKMVGHPSRIWHGPRPRTNPKSGVTKLTEMGEKWSTGGTGVLDRVAGIGGVDVVGPGTPEGVDVVELGRPAAANPTAPLTRRRPTTIRNRAARRRRTAHYRPACLWSPTADVRDDRGHTGQTELVSGLERAVLSEERDGRWSMCGGERLSESVSLSSDATTGSSQASTRPRRCRNCPQFVCDSASSSLPPTQFQRTWKCGGDGRSCRADAHDPT